MNQMLDITIWKRLFDGGHQANNKLFAGGPLEIKNLDKLIDKNPIYLEPLRWRLGMGGGGKTHVIHITDIY